ncbi:MAG: cell wall metabolism sensor histidine kinase WalK [Armatimonadetes bacterium]|nr:cell wall metabolism sensor histidine kinase WalK [Armatimonadota bacterium]MDW8154888.1 ATP-binding protein [Armatimonadota bacterium]
MRVLFVFLGSALVGTGVWALVADRIPAWLLALLGLGGGAGLLAAAARERRLRDACTRLARYLRSLQPLPGALEPGTGDVEELAAAVDAAARHFSESLSRAWREFERLRRVLDALEEGVLVFDRSRRLVLANRPAEQLLGFRFEHSRGTSPMAVFRRHEVDALLRRCAEEGAVRPLEIELTVPDRRAVRVTAAPLGPGNGVVVILRDLTELRRVEAIRRDFVANVSHELRTPLASLRAMAEALQDGGLEDPGLARRFLAQMVQEVDRLSQLAEELLELSVLESGAARLRKEPLRTRELLEEVAERFGPAAGRKRIRLLVEGEDLWLVADRERMLQALGNLVDNALKFTPEGGSVWLRTESRPGEVTFVVEDTGPGIPPEHLPRIFERFYRAEPSRTRESGGAGLGLAITKHIVLAHGGRVAASNRPEGGARFTLVLPAGSPSDASVARATGSPDAGTDEPILTP